MLCYSLVAFAVVFIGSTLFALQQLSGINAVFYFSSTVFRSAGVSSNLANAFIGFANLIGKPSFFVILCMCSCVYICISLANYSKSVFLGMDIETRYSIRAINKYVKDEFV